MRFVIPAFAALLLTSATASAQLPVRNVFLGPNGQFTGMAPQGATQVRLINNGDVLTIDVAADGTFTFPGPLEPGNYTTQFLNADSQPINDGFGQFETNLYEAGDPNAPPETTEAFDPTPQPGDPLPDGQQVQPPPPGGGPPPGFGAPGGGSGGGGAMGDGGSGWWALAGLGGLAGLAGGDGDDDDDGGPGVVIRSPIQ